MPTYPDKIDVDPPIRNAKVVQKADFVPAPDRAVKVYKTTLKHTKKPQQMPYSALKNARAPISIFLWIPGTFAKPTSVPPSRATYRKKTS